MLQIVSFMLFCLISFAFADVTINKVYQFPPFTAVENLAVRSNGVIVFNTVSAPNTWFIDPRLPNPTPTLIYSFPGASSLTGITEVYPDIFAVVVGNYTIATKQGVPGSFSVWTIDLRSSTPIVQKVAAIPEAQALNGMTNLGFPNAGMVLIADSKLGAIWMLNVDTGSYQIIASDPLLQTTSTKPLGINGLHVRGHLLYFTNSAQGIYGSIGISHIWPSLSYEVKVIATPYNNTYPGYPVNIYDDFAFDENGTAWITNHPNTMTTVDRNGVQNLITSNVVIQPTSCAFGRGSQVERCTLYITCAGQVYNSSYIISGGLYSMNVC